MPTVWGPGVARGMVIAAGIAAGLAALATGAAAQSSCQADLEKLAQSRIAAISSLNSLAKSGKGKLDPIAACPKLRALAAIEAQFSEYMAKNKDWCGIPDNVVASISASRAKTVQVAGQACGIAAQVKKQQALMAKQAQQQAAEGGPFGAQPAAPRMPTGPL